MSLNIVAFGGSNSKHSINKRFASYAASRLSNAEITLLDLNDFEMPIYSIDREKESGFPELAVRFKERIEGADALVVSLAEHNSSYTAAYKNIYDWVSRIDRKVWAGKPMFLLGAAPGGRGAKSVLNIALGSFQRMNPEKVVSFSLPVFHENFTDDKGISDAALSAEFEEQLKKFETLLAAIGKGE